MYSMKRAAIHGADQCKNWLAWIVWVQLWLLNMALEGPIESLSGSIGTIVLLSSSWLPWSRLSWPFAPVSLLPWVHLSRLFFPRWFVCFHLGSSCFSDASGFHLWSPLFVCSVSFLFVSRIKGHLFGNSCLHLLHLCLSPVHKTLTWGHRQK